MMLRPIVIVAAMLAPALAGCIGGDDAAEAPGEDLSRLALAAQDCDRPLLDERVRAREFDIATDPNDPSHLVATMMVPWPTQYAAAPYDAMGWSGLAQSEDGGLTWTYAPLSGYPGDPNIATSPWAGAVFAGDPFVQFLPDGGFLLAVMIIYPPVTVTLQIGKFPWGSFEPEYTATLSNGALGPGLHDVPTTQPLMHNDYEKFTVDPVTGDLYMGWSYRWQQSASALAVFAKSADEGRTWTEPLPIAPVEPHYLVADEHQMDPWPLVAPDGHLVMPWTNWGDGALSDRGSALYVSESTDGGATWSERRVVREQPGLGLGAAAVDRSGGPDDGSMYILAADAREGESALFLSISRDGGATWTEEVRVNEADTASPRMPDLVVDPEGRVSILYMAEVGDPQQVHAFVAHSIDGGRTFATHRVTREPTSPTSMNNQPSFLTHLGDYIGITYNERGVVALWQDGRESTAETPYSEGWMCELPTRAT